MVVFSDGDIFMKRTVLCYLFLFLVSIVFVCENFFCNHSSGAVVFTPLALW